MKKQFMMLVGILVIGSQLVGCQEETTQKEPEQVTKLVWQSNQNFESHEAYFNQVLKEKNFPYEVDFIAEDTKKEGQAIDFKEVSRSWENLYDATTEIAAGEFLALDEYLNTKEGKSIKESIPENVWDTYKVDGKQYTILSVGFVPTKTVYIWNTQLAEKYDVHPEEWNEKIWEYEEELQKINTGEKGKDGFVTVEGLRQYSDSLKENTEVLGVCYPLVINETEQIPEAKFLFETPEYQEYLKGVQSLYEKGIYAPDIEVNTELDVTSFLKIETDFKTKDAYLAWQSEDFWDTHEIKELWRAPLWRLSCGASQVGITTESKYPQEAFSFLCELYKDAELTNALMWGEEGKDYEVRGNTAQKPIAGGYIPALYVGNNFISYAEVGQDEKKKELYPKWLEECENSKLNGFNFSGQNCMEELKKLYELWNQLGQKSGKSILEEHNTIIQQYKEAGIDKVIAEWNRQYQAWSAKQ